MNSKKISLVFILLVFGLFSEGKSVAKDLNKDNNKALNLASNTKTYCGPPVAFFSGYNFKVFGCTSAIAEGKVKNNEDALEAGKWFISRGVKNTIITMGRNGVVWVSNETNKFYKTPNVTENDTTGAGDIFAGAFLKEFVDTNNVDKSIQYAVVAASLSVEKAGVVESIPSQEHIQTFMKK